MLLSEHLLKMKQGMAMRGHDGVVIAKTYRLVTSRLPVVGRSVCQPVIISKSVAGSYTSMHLFNVDLCAVATVCT